MQFMQNQQKKNTKGVSPIAAGITGVVIGAAAVALADKQTRKRATDKAMKTKDELQKWSSKTMKDIQTRGDKVKADSKDVVNDKKETVSKQLKDKIDETFK